MVAYCWEPASLVFPKDGRVSERDRETEVDGRTKRERKRDKERQRQREHWEECGGDAVHRGVRETRLTHLIIKYF